MPIETAEGIRVPAIGDNYALTTDLRLMAESIDKVVPVANAGARTALVAALVATGRGPTSANPLYVHRADASPLKRLESTIDGTVWTSHDAAPTVKPFAYGALARTDGALVLNSGVTDLKIVAEASTGAGWDTTWNGSGIANSTPGRWWVQATLATNVTGSRYLELGVRGLSSGSLGLLGPTAADTASTGFGRATMEGLVISDGTFGITLSVSNSGGAGTIRSGAMRAVWLGPA